MTDHFLFCFCFRCCFFNTLLFLQYFVVSICNGGSLRKAGPAVKGRVDRVPPTLFGAVREPADGEWFPGDKISARFVEV